MRGKKSAVHLLYEGSAVLGGTLAGLWAFTANRFQISESVMIVFWGMVAGASFATICYAIIRLLKE